MTESPQPLKEDLAIDIEQNVTDSKNHSEDADKPSEPEGNGAKNPNINIDTSVREHGPNDTTSDGSPPSWGIHEDLKHLQEDDIILAATLVIDAKEGRNFTFKTDPTYVRSYNLYHKFYLRYLLYFMILFNLSLALFERPAKSGWEIPYWASMLLETMCLAFFIYRFLHSAYFSQREVFFRDTKNWLIIVVIMPVIGRANIH